jgi:uncharacterized delta-60 repeat protein
MPFASAIASEDETGCPRRLKEVVMTYGRRRNPIVIVLACALISMFAGPVHAAPGDLDPSFGGDGKVLTDFTKGRDGARDVAIQANGKIVVVGRASTRRGYGRFALARYRANGHLDPAFGGDGSVTTNFAKREDSASAVAIQADGKIVAVGGADTTARVGVFAVARYDRDGTLDTTFGGDGKVTTSFTGGHDAASDVAIQTDGKIVVVGTTGPGEFALARFDPDGTLDTTFDSDGKVTTSVSAGTDSADAVAIQADGKIVVAGDSWTETGWDGIDVVRYETDGSIDTAFGTGGVATVEFTNGSPGGGDGAGGVAIQSDGKIVVAGDAGFCCEFTSSFGVARFDGDGTLDTTFSGNGKVVTNFTKNDDSAGDVAIQADGKIVAVGVAGYQWGKIATFALVRYDTDGTLDRTFGNQGKLRTAFRATVPSDPIGILGAWAGAVAIQTDGRIVAVGGADREVDGRIDGRFALARYLNG